MFKIKTIKKYGQTDIPFLTVYSTIKGNPPLSSKIGSMVNKNPKSIWLSIYSLFEEFVLNAEIASIMNFSTGFMSSQVSTLIV